MHAFLLNLYKQFPTTPTRLIAIVGNKADKRPREVLETEGRQLADEHGAIFWETSAVDAKGFDGACINLLREMGAGRDAPSCTTEDSTTAIKQSQTDWIQPILWALHWIPGWVCGIRTE